MAVGNTLLHRTGNGTDALSGREKAILRVIGIDGAVGGEWEKGVFPQPAWRYPKAEADLEIEAQRDVNAQHGSRRRAFLGGPHFLSLVPDRPLPCHGNVPSTTARGR